MHCTSIYICDKMYEIWNRRVWKEDIELKKNQFEDFHHIMFHYCYLYFYRSVAPHHTTLLFTGKRPQYRQPSTTAIVPIYFTGQIENFATFIFYRCTLSVMASHRIQHCTLHYVQLQRCEYVSSSDTYTKTTYHSTHTHIMERT